KKADDIDKHADRGLSVQGQPLSHDCIAPMARDRRESFTGLGVARRSSASHGLWQRHAAITVPKWDRASGAKRDESERRPEPQAGLVMEEETSEAAVPDDGRRATNAGTAACLDQGRLPVGKGHAAIGFTAVLAGVAGVFLAPAFLAAALVAA